MAKHGGTVRTALSGNGVDVKTRADTFNTVRTNLQSSDQNHRQLALF